MSSTADFAGAAYIRRSPTTGSSGSSASCRGRNRRDLDRLLRRAGGRHVRGPLPLLPPISGGASPRSLRRPGRALLPAAQPLRCSGPDHVGLASRDAHAVRDLMDSGAVTVKRAQSRSAKRWLREEQIEPSRLWSRGPLVEFCIPCKAAATGRCRWALERKPILSWDASMASPECTTRQTAICVPVSGGSRTSGGRSQPSLTAVPDALTMSMFEPTVS